MTRMRCLDRKQGFAQIVSAKLCRPIGFEHASEDQQAVNADNNHSPGAAQATNGAWGKR